MNEQNNNLGNNSGSTNIGPNQINNNDVLESINTIQPEAVPNMPLNQIPVTDLQTNNQGIAPVSTSEPIHDIGPSQNIAPIQNIGQNQNVGPVQNTVANQNNFGQEQTVTPVVNQVSSPVVNEQPIQNEPVNLNQPTPVVQNEGQTIPQQQNIISSVQTITTDNSAGQMQNEMMMAPATPTNTQVENNNPNVYFGPSKPMSSDADITNVGFVAADIPAPKKKSKIPLIIMIILLIGLGLLGYFVGYPYVVKTFFNKPINVYKTTINETFKKINTTINETVHDKVIYNVELSLNSNMEVLQPYSNYKYGLDFGIDSTSKNMQLGYSIVTPDNLEYSAYSYVKDNKKYERYSTYRDVNGKVGLIYTGDVNNDELSDLFSSFQLLLDNSNKVTSEDLTYLTDKLSQTLIDSIDENKLTKEDASITVNGEKLKVTNNKYTMDLDNKRRTVKYLLDELKKDDKALQIIAKLLSLTEDEIKQTLDINVDELITSDNVIYINIYTYGNKNTIIGYAINDSDEEFEFHYYSKNKNYFEAYVYASIENDETGKKEENKLDIKGVNNSDGNKITVLYNDKEVLVLNVNSWEENNIEFDYTLRDDDGDYTGHIKYLKEVNNDRLKITFDFSTKVARDEINIGLVFTEDWNSEVANINTSATGAVVTLGEEELNAVRERFSTEIYNTPLGLQFQTVSGMYTPSINEYYDNNTNNLEPPTDNENEVTDNYTDTDTGTDINQNGTEVNGY